MISLWRMFLASWKHLARNSWLALATVFVFTMALLSVNVLLGVQALFGRVVTILESRVDMTVAFKPDTPEGVLTQAKFYLVSLPQVAEVQLKSATEVQADFKTQHANDLKILAALDELTDNPLGAQLVIKAKHTEDYPFLVEAIRSPQYAPFVQTQTYDDHQLAIARVRDISQNARLFGAILVALFALFGMLIAFNAIRVAIYAQREEISVMRLVGASSSFIRVPFILEGIWLAIFSLALTALAVFFGIQSAEPSLRPLFDGFDPGLATFFTQNAPTILLFEGGGLIVLVVLISWVAAGKYIKR